MAHGSGQNRNAAFLEWVLSWLLENRQPPQLKIAFRLQLSSIQQLQHLLQIRAVRVRLALGPEILPNSIPEISIQSTFSPRAGQKAE